jgi:hypothetical protein
VRQEGKRDPEDVDILRLKQPGVGVDLVGCPPQAATDAAEQNSAKEAVARARRIQRFLSQPMFVSEVFTGRPGKQVPVADTVRGFKEILEGKHDDVSEQNFYMKGGIEEIAES